MLLIKFLKIVATDFVCPHEDGGGLLVPGKKQKVKVDRGLTNNFLTKLEIQAFRGIGPLMDIKF